MFKKVTLLTLILIVMVSGIAFAGEFRSVDWGMS